MKTLPRFLKARFGSRKGAAMIETTFVLMLFFGTLFMTIDMGRIGFQMATLNQTVKEAAHWGSLGVIDSGAEGADTSTQRMNTIRQRAKKIWEDWGMNPDSLTISIKTLPGSYGLNTVVPNSPGSSGDFLIVEGRVATNIGSFLGMLTGTGYGMPIELKARGITRNE